MPNTSDLAQIPLSSLFEHLRLRRHQTLITLKDISYVLFSFGPAPHVDAHSPSRGYRPATIFLLISLPLAQCVL